MTPGIHDFVTIKGNTLPIVLRFPDFDATGSQFVFRCVWGGGATTLRKATLDGNIAVSVEPDPADPVKSISTLTCSLSAAETRSLDTGRVNRYEIERRIDGTETTILTGYIEANAGVNDDA